MAELGVNIDHVATVREARKTYEPDPVWAAAMAELGGADAITVHLREDRRHIQERDVRLIRETASVRVNLELACETDVLQIAQEVAPHQATLVPERREEVTTEGGLDVTGQRDIIRHAVQTLQAAGVEVSLFIDPDDDQIRASADLGVTAIELHTGQYALAGGQRLEAEKSRLAEAAKLTHQLGLRLHAGHGLNYQNVQFVAALPHMHELNIGHSIVSRAIFVGLRAAVGEMKQLIRLAGR